MENGRPRLETKHGIFVDQFLPASSQGTRPDVGGCLAGAYRHCVVCCCRSGMDFDETAKEGFLTTHRGRWVNLSLSLRDVFVTFG